MSAAAEIQSGRAGLFGIAPITLTPSAGSALTGNFSNMTWTDSWNEVEMAAQNGATVEMLVSSQRRRKLKFDFAPAGALGGTMGRTEAKAACAALIALTPNIVITLAAEDIAASTAGLNTTYNFKSGGTLTRTREGWAVAGIELETYESTTAGTFAALATV